MGNIFRRAATDTWKQIGSFSGVFLLLAGPVLGLAVQFYYQGSLDVIGDVGPVVAGLAGLGVAVILMLLWNFAAAPYRLVCERAENAEKLNSQLAEKLAPRPDFAIKMHQAGTSTHIYPGEKRLQDTGAFLLYLEVANTGNRKSALKDWRVFTVNKDTGERIKLHPFRLYDNQSVTFGLETGDVEVTNRTFITTRSLSAIADGDFIDGYVLALCDPGIISSAKAVGVLCRDVFGNSYEAEMPLEGNQVQLIPTVSGAKTQGRKLR